MSTLWETARDMKIEQFVEFFDNFLNFGGKQFSAGKAVGLAFQNKHRSLQRCAIAFALGIICGLGETDPKFTDARNETAILTANKIHEMESNGELPLGMYI